MGRWLSVPWWSEDRTGRLSHGLEIELENFGMAVLGTPRLCSLRIG